MNDLERFPTSPTAQRMMKTVSPIYDKSYVGKWIFQVIGLEMDEAWKLFEELRLQAFPETATWGIVYWEQRYHIAPDNSLTLEERRQRVNIKRGKRKPMNPARLEHFARAVSQRQTVVTERNEEYSFFISILPGESEVDYSEFISIIRSVKPSHISIRVIFQTDVGLTIQATSQDKYSFSYTPAGTVPDTNMVGGLGENSLLLETGMECHPFDYEVAGTGEAGEHPQINTVGRIGQGALIPSISATGSAFDYQLCGEEEREF